MLKNALRLGLLMVMTGSLLGGANARHNDKGVTNKDDHQVVVVVREGRKGLEFQIGADKYDSGQAAFYLGELRLTKDRNTAIVAVVDARVELEAIRAVPAMAIAAGFNNVHTYVYWPWTKKMAEIRFGPVLNFSKHPPSE